MKNIHLLPTNNQHQGSISLTPDNRLSKNVLIGIPHHIYITADEEIKEGDWYLTFINNEVIGQPRKCADFDWNFSSCKKIVLTTDQDLIANGVQAIDNEFLNWFVNNSNFESVVIKKEKFVLGEAQGTKYIDFNYKAIIPTEEPKKETVEEAAERYSQEGKRTQLEENFAFIDFINGAKWQAEGMYNEKEVFEIIAEILHTPSLREGSWEDIGEWFKQFKKK